MARRGPLLLVVLRSRASGDRTWPATFVIESCYIVRTIGRYVAHCFDIGTWDVDWTPRFPPSMVNKLSGFTTFRFRFKSRNGKYNITVLGSREVKGIRVALLHVVVAIAVERAIMSLRI